MRGTGSAAGCAAARAAAALAGAVLMGAELVAGAWLTPHFGSTVETWSFLIGATLLASAAGAWVGGRWSAKGARRGIAVPLLVAGTWILAGGFLMPGLVGAMAGLDGLWGVAGSSVLAVFVPVAAMATLLPVLVEARSTAAGPGREVGGLAAASAIGSLAGTLGTGVWLLPAFGTRATATILAGAALAGGAVALRAGLASRAGAAASAVALAWLLGPSAGSGIDGVFEIASMRGVLRLDARGAEVRLSVNGIMQSRFAPAMLRRGTLIGGRCYFELLPWMRPGLFKTLHVGLGAGLVPDVLERHGLVVESVEVDRRLVRLLREHLGFDGIVHEGDGRAVARRLQGPYDFILLDAFAGESVPAHLVTAQAFMEMRGKLAEDGVLAIHLIGFPSSAAIGAAARTLASVFPHTLAIRSGFGEELQDLYLFASDRELVVPTDPELASLGWIGDEAFAPKTAGAPVLTDDRNPFESLNRAAARALRAASLRGAGS